MTYRDFSQGAFRMRGIGKGQKITLFLIPEVHDLIKREVGRADDEELIQPTSGSPPTHTADTTSLPYPAILSPEPSPSTTPTDVLVGALPEKEQDDDYEGGLLPPVLTRRVSLQEKLNRERNLSNDSACSGEGGLGEMSELLLSPPVLTRTSSLKQGMTNNSGLLVAISAWLVINTMTTEAVTLLTLLTRTL